MFLIEYNALQDCAYFNCFPVMVSDFRTTLAVLLECQIQNQSKQDLILKFLECFSIRQNKKKTTCLPLIYSLFWLLSLWHNHRFFSLWHSLLALLSHCLLWKCKFYMEIITVIYKSTNVDIASVAHSICIVFLLNNECKRRTYTFLLYFCSVLFYFCDKLYQNYK